MDQIDLPVHFGEWLKRQRRRLDLTQEELADQSGCSVFTIRKIEGGERRPSKQLAELLARSLGIPDEDKGTFVRVARGELNLERLRSPARARPAHPAIVSKPYIPPHNLPVPPTPLVGREFELAGIKRLLAEPDCRLVTITGLGGIGKTRLAIEAASAVQDHFPDGVVFVELAALSSPALIVPAITEALGFTPAGPEDLHKQLLGALKEKRLLFVMDNAEHLLDGTGLFSEMLENAPYLKMVVTSRERLNLQIEWVFDLQGLPIPPVEPVDQFEEFSSIALFLQRARQFKLDFTIGEGEKPYVAQICRMVEGMPLGIELAAAWVQVLSCKEIAQEIEARLDFLSARLRGVPQRHRSLRATLDYSWNLLNAEEQALFLRLSVFRGGFSRQAVESVAGGSLSGLSALLSKSLITRKSGTHFDMHPLIHQYAVERLQEDPDLHLHMLERHRGYFIEFLSGLHPDVRGPNMQAALKSIQADLDNVREAWQRTINERRFANLRQAEKCLYDFYELRDRREEGFAVLSSAAGVLQEELHQRPGDLELQTLLGLLIIDQSYLGSVFLKLSEVLALARQGHGYLEGGNDEPAFGYATLWLALIHLRAGDLVLAEQHVFEASKIFRRCGDERGIATALGTEARIRLALRQFEAGLRAAEGSESIYRRYETEEGICRSLIVRGELEYHLERYDRAKGLFEGALALSKSGDLPLYTGVALYLLAQLAQDRNDLDEARVLLEESSAFLSGREALTSQSMMFRRLGDLHAASGDFQEASIYLGKSLDMLVQLENFAPALDVLLDYARLLARQGQSEQALGWASFIIHEPRTWPLTRHRTEGLRRELLPGLAPEQVQAAEEFAQGQSLGKIKAVFLPFSPIS